MHILLTYPNIGTRNGPHYPHGVGSLAAAATAAGHKVHVRLLEQMPDREQWQAILDESQPDLHACSFGSHQWPYARELMTWTREDEIPTLAGGVHATFAAEQVLAADVCDWVCVGEGEDALIDLANGMKPREIANLRGYDFTNPPRPLIADLDELPVYGRRHFPMEEITRVNGGEMTALIGRGCPYPCTYCCNAAWRELYRGQAWVRWRSLDHLFAELDLLRSLYQVDSFYFEDDIFTLNREFLDGFLEQYPRRFGVPFRAYLRIGSVERDDLRRLRDAGLVMANVGIEHGDERMRVEVLGRKMDNEQIVDFFDWSRELGIRTRAFHIVGVPGETPATLQATRKLCRRVAPDEVQVSLFEPYPGTKLYRQCLEDGSFKGIERDTYFDEQAAITLVDFPEDELIATYHAFCDEAKEIEDHAFVLALQYRRRGEIDLVAEWSPDCVQQMGAEPVARKRVRFGNDERFCLFTHPRSLIAYDIPPGRYRFRAGLALDPICLNWGGGGARFLVQVDEQLLLDRMIDPKHNEQDMGWTDVDISFTATAPTTLRLLTQPESDDLTALWALWGHPHLVWEGDA